MPENPLIEDPVLLKRLAKYIVQQCFRNTVLEGYHAGTVPDSQIGDYSDVVVKSPFGEVPWRELSRISDEEMKALMKDSVSGLKILTPMAAPIPTSPAASTPTTSLMLDISLADK